MVNVSLKLSGVDANEVFIEALKYKQQGWSLLNIDKDEKGLWNISMIMMNKK